MEKIGIVGGAGYTGGELLRILVNHPLVEIAFVHSNSNAGNPIYKVHQDLIGYTDLTFTDTLSTDIDVLIMCLGHGDAAKFLEQHPEFLSLKIVDLSTDFRHEKPGNTFVYGLPELNRSAIKLAKHIANPGCFATCIQLGLLPLAKHQFIQDEIHITAITGSTGAGQKPTETSHFSWRHANISVYKAFSHQHEVEINQSLNQLQMGLGNKLNFVPIRGDFPRGIFASMYIKTDKSIDEIKAIYNMYYKDHPFAHVVDVNPNLKQVINTNNCLIYLEKHGDKLQIISMIDNLVKGASGQAVQNMNLILGLPENEGLRLKPSGF